MHQISDLHTVYIQESFINILSSNFKQNAILSMQGLMLLKLTFQLLICSHLRPNY